VKSDSIRVELKNKLVLNSSDSFGKDKRSKNKVSTEVESDTYIR